MSRRRLLWVEIEKIQRDWSCQWVILGQGMLASHMQKDLDGIKEESYQEAHESLGGIASFQ
jgi:hypothetical protein